MVGYRKSLLPLVALVFTVPASSEAQLWHHLVGPGTGVANALITVPGGDVVAAGVTTPSPALGTVVRLGGASGTEVWRTNLSGDLAQAYNEMLAVAADSAGGVFVGGRVRNAATSWDFTVAKLAPADGSTIWRREIDGAGADGATTFDVASSLAVDAAGDVIAAGGLVEDTLDSFTVIKFAGADGTVLWKRELDAPSYGLARRVVIDGTGDVVAAGTTSTGGFTVTKLAGATGAQLWRYDTPGDARGVAIDGSGNVLAVGQGYVPATGSVPTFMLVVKLAGPSGTELWRDHVQGITVSSGAGSDVAVDAAGDVVAGGIVNEHNVSVGDFTVAKLAGPTGQELWRRSISGSCCYSEALRVAIDPAGDVVATGRVAGPILGSHAADYDMAVTKLAGSTGTTLWARQLGAGINDSAGDVAIDAAGDVLAAGAFSEAPGAYSGSFAVAKLSARTGSDYLLSGRRLTVSDAGPTARSLSVSSKTRIVPPLLASSGTDPRVNGAVLDLVNPTTGETATIALPAAAWRALGSPAGSKGYRYDDHFRTLGPCSKVLVSSTRLSARCAGAGIGFSLDEASQGALGVRLVMGPDALRRCLLFGGGVQRDARGSFIAVKSPPPAACP